MRNGGANEPAVKLTGGTSEQASHQRATTEQLLASTEANLKQVGEKRLSAGQRDMVTQIRQFIEQAKTAVSSGDLERGRNLAMKAHLLADELVKPQ